MKRIVAAMTAGLMMCGCAPRDAPVRGYQPHTDERESPADLGPPEWPFSADIESAEVGIRMSYTGGFAGLDGSIAAIDGTLLVGSGTAVQEFPLSWEEFARIVRLMEQVEWDSITDDQPRLAIGVDLLWFTYEVKQRGELHVAPVVLGPAPLREIRDELFRLRALVR